MLVVEPVQAAVWHCLNYYAYEDAVFLAERLFAQAENDDNLYLLATCYYRCGKKNQAYSLLKNQSALKRHPQSRFLFARCAYDLQKYGEAENVLCGVNTPCDVNLNELEKQYGDIGCFALQLLGWVLLKSERNASEALTKALKANPFLWSCFASLCNIGEKPNPDELFKVSHLQNFTQCHGSAGVIYTENVTVETTTNNNNSAQNQNNSNQINANSTPINQILQLVTPVNNCYPLKNMALMRTPNFSPINTNQFQTSQDDTFNNANYTATPLLGIYPLERSTPNEIFIMSPSLVQENPPFNTVALSEANYSSDQKSITKRVYQQFGQLINRRNDTTPLQLSKPIFPNQTTLNTTPLINNTGSVPNVRRSSRLFSNSVKENNKSQTGGGLNNNSVSSNIKENKNEKSPLKKSPLKNKDKFVTPKSPSRKTKNRISKSVTHLNNNNSQKSLMINGIYKKKIETTINDEKQQQTPPPSIVNLNLNQNNVTFQKSCSEGLMSIMRQLGEAYLCLKQFNCRKAIEKFEELPEKQYNSCWVLSMLGVAHYEINQYAESCQYFKKVHDLEPSRLEYMELYSTSLWQLQKEVELSALAQDLSDLDKNSPITWCVAGNCFSLQKEHDAAIRLIQRAVQCDPNFSYAWNLLGDEYVTTEELDKAMICFRKTIKFDPRNYKAWFGLGTIYSKQEVYKLAEYNFRMALKINRESSITLCHIGVVQNALNKTDEALKTLNLAIRMDPNNPLCKFHRASIYFTMKYYAEALQQLEELKNIIPRESRVYYLIGKIHQQLGNKHRAILHFRWASDLDPKGANNPMKDFETTSQLGSTTKSTPAVDETPAETSTGDSSMLELNQGALESDDSNL